jgi:hypothetical protein
MPVKAYEALSPDSAVLSYRDDLRWIAGFVEYATMHFEKKEPFSIRNYSAKIREMLEKHLQVTVITTLIQFRALTDPAFFDDFKEGKRSEQLQKIGCRSEERPAAYSTGVKILHYGQMIGVVVERRDVVSIRIEAGSRIHVNVTFASTDEEVRQAIENWQRTCVMEDATAFAQHYGDQLDLFPKSIRVKEQKHIWASCGKDKSINLFLPTANL